MHECEFCKKVFKNNYNLQHHKTTTKKCLKIQGATPCNLCGEYYVEESYTKHTKDCINKLKMENELLKKQLEIELEKNKKLQDQMFKVASKPTTVTVGKVSQKIINQLAPFSLSKERIAQIVDEKFTENHLCLHERGFVNFAVENILTDNDGKFQMICTDPARRNFIYKTETEEIYKDPDATQFTDMYIPSLEKKSGKIIKKILKDDTANLEEHQLIMDSLSKIEKIKDNKSILTSELAKKLAVKPGQ